jgi:hypothetical protein
MSISILLVIVGGTAISGNDSYGVVNNRAVIFNRFAILWWIFERSGSCP